MTKRKILFILKSFLQMDTSRYVFTGGSKDRKDRKNNGGGRTPFGVNQFLLIYQRLYSICFIIQARNNSTCYPLFSF